MCTTKNYNHMMYNSWDMEGDRQNFLLFWAIFCPFTTTPPPHDLENQNFGKERKKCLEISFFYTYMCNIIEDHMIHCSWNIKCDRQKCLSSLAIFCPLSPLTTWKMKILKLKKIPGDIIILHICTIIGNHDVWLLRYGTGQFFVILDFFSFFPIWTQKIKILKKWKKYLKILSFYNCVP